MGTAGTHIPSLFQEKVSIEVPAQKPEQKLCDECGKKPAYRFCLCTSPFPKFCEGCESNQIMLHVTHSIHPISVYQSMASGRVPIEAIRSKQKYVSDLKARLQDELIRFDAYARKIETEFEALVAQINARKEEILNDLCAKRRKLTEYLDEMQHTIESKRYEESFQVVTMLEGYIASGYISSTVPEVQIFTGKVELQSIYEALKKCVTYGVVESPLQQAIESVIPVIKGNSLRLYSRKTLQMSKFNLYPATRIDHSSAYCFIGPDTLLAVGGTSHNEVYEINVRTGHVDQSSKMTSNRWHAGIYPYKGEFVFVFGGNTGTIPYANTSEKYELSLKSWSNVSNPMQRGKHCCSVCEHTSGLYVSGVEEAGSSIECFSPMGETFRLLRTDSIRYAPMLCCLGEDLYHVRQNQVEVANLSSSTAVTFTMKTTFSHSGHGWYWLCCPLKLQGGVLISVLNHWFAPIGLFSFKPIQGQFTQVATFTY